ncbi:MAG: ArsR family transcriptional regulator [Amphritea sp.]
MKNKEKIPEERNETIRQEILRFLEGSELTIGELSKQIGKSESELYDHLEHLLGFKSLRIIPAECLKCGYVFGNREKTKKPGKCPKCRGTYIEEPRFTTATT